MTRSKGFHKSKSRKRSKAGKKAYATRMANEAAAARVAAVADSPPPAAVAAPAADAAAAVADAAPAAPAKKKRGPRRKPHKPDQNKDGILYILNRFGKKYANWRKRHPRTPTAKFEGALKRRYGEKTAADIMFTIRFYRAGELVGKTRKGKNFYQRRSPYPALLQGYSLRQIMSLAREYARLKNDGVTFSKYAIIGDTGNTDEESNNIYDAIKSCVKQYKSGKREGQYYASLAAAKKVCNEKEVKPIRWKGSNGFTYSLAKIARAVCKDMNWHGKGERLSDNKINELVKNYRGMYDGGDDKLIEVL